MKQLFKRSAAFLLCLAMLMGLFAGVPGAVISKVSAEETESTFEMKNVYNYSFEDVTSTSELLSKGWDYYSGHSSKVYSIADDANRGKVLKFAHDGSLTLLFDKDGNPVWKMNGEEYVLDDDGNKIQDTTAPFGIRSEYIPIDGDSDVYLTVDVKSEREDNGAGVMVYLYWFDADKKQISVKAEGFRTIGTAWKECSVVAKSVPAEAEYVRVMLYDSSSAVDTLYMDNLRITEINDTRASITTAVDASIHASSSNTNHAVGKVTFPYETLADAAPDFEGMSIALLRAMGWNSAVWNELSTDYCQERDTMVIKSSTTKVRYLFAPLVDISDMTTFEFLVDANVTSNNGAGNANLMLYIYYYDENGIGVNSKSLGQTVKEGMWETYTIGQISAPPGAVYALPMIQYRGDVQFDNLAIEAPVTITYPTELNEDFTGTTVGSLIRNGWEAKADGKSFATKFDGSNGVLVHSASGATAQLYTTYVDVTDLEQVTVYAEGQDTGDLGIFVYFYDANLTQTYSAGWNGLSTGSEAWTACSKTYTLADFAEELTAGEIKYVRVMIYPSSKDTSTAYIDNIAINHTHAFTKASNLLVAAGDCTNPTTYYGECECGTVSHVATVEAAAPGHTDTTPKDHKCDVCGEACGDPHEAAEGTHICAYCGQVASECVDADPKDHKCDVCGEACGDPHVAAEGTHNCAYCGQPASECVDADPKDHKCDVCGEACGDPHVAAEGTHNCAYCGQPASECVDADPEDHKCDTCGDVLSTCEQNWVAGTYVEPTFESDGYTPYTCSVCGAEKKEYNEGTKLTAVAQIGDKLYESLEEAVADGGTIVLLANITVDAQLATAANTVINLNGYTLTVIEKITVNAGHTLQVTGEGKLIVNAEIAVAGTLDVYDLPCSATAGLVPGQSGTLAIANGGSVKLMSVWAGHTAEQLRTYRATFFNGTVAGAKVTVGTKNYTMNANGNWIIDGAVATISRTNNGAAIVESYTTLDAAIADAKAGETVKLLTDVTLAGTEVVNSDNGTELAAVVIRNGITLDGAGHTITATGCKYGIYTTGGVIKNVTVVGGSRAVFMDAYAAYDLVLDNVKLDGTYALSVTMNTRPAAKISLYVVDSELLGWTSYSDFCISEATFENCAFGKGSTGYAYFKPYIDTNIIGENTTFSEGFTIDAAKANTVIASDVDTTNVALAENCHMIDNVVGLHIWGEATCTEPAKCECGDTKGEALGHDSKYVDNGDGTHDYVCGVCNTVEIDNEDHIYDDDKDTVCNVCPAERVVEDEVKNYATSLGGDIGFKMYFDLTEKTLADEEAYVLFKIDGVEVERQYIRDAGAPDQDGEYAFVCGVAAAQMTKKVSVQIVYGDNTTSEAKEYTILEYAKKRLDNPEAPEKEKALIRAMLNYGAYAQEFFGYNTGDLANTDISGLADVTTVTAADITVGNTQNGKATGIVIDGYSALLESETTFKFSFALESGANIADYTFSYVDADGKTVPMTPKQDADGCYCVYIEDIPAAYLDQMYTITVKNNNDASSYSLTTCVLCYAKAVINNSNNTAAKVNMAKALYLYNQAANAYFNK